ncbi:glutamate-gated chloride channel isoform X2 [Folsomia candida]|uniref:glutamate-gated chloride channel isoform X2 n=1 Tax=Folsomia candida TaxID=158441 RepID=UPI000B8F19EC|nr:glutamate-gated chloride channel isoform X2 [Folsomia candida]
MSKLTGLLLIIGVIGLSSGLPASTKQVKATLFARNIDPTELPTGSNGTGPVHVVLNVQVKTLLAADSKSRSLKLQMLVKMRWTDRRLVYTPFPPDTSPDNVTLDSSALEKFWVPMIYYVNGLEKETDKANQFIRVFVKTGEVEYSSLVTITTSCPMNLRYFPHDTQTCLVQLSSYGNSVSDMVFEWNKKSAASVLPNVALPDYSLQDYTTRNCDAVTNTGVYSCLQLELKLKREGGFYCMHVYIPCTMLILVSWLSYFLHPTKSATARLIVVIAALALAVVGISNFNLQAPRTGYTKSIDVWTGISLTFILIALVEFVAVNYMNQYPCPRSKYCKKQPPPSDGVDNAEQQTPLNPNGEGKSPQQCKMFEDSEDGNTCGAKLDVIFRISIPGLFLVFAILYWILFV